MSSPERIRPISSENTSCSVRRAAAGPIASTTFLGSTCTSRAAVAVSTAPASIADSIAALESPRIAPPTSESTSTGSAVTCRVLRETASSEAIAVSDRPAAKSRTADNAAARESDRIGARCGSSSAKPSLRSRPQSQPSTRLACMKSPMARPARSSASVVAGLAATSVCGSPKAFAIVSRSSASIASHAVNACR